MQQGKLSKGDRLGPADHSKISYPPFRRNFYIEVPELARMSDAAVAANRKDLDEIKVPITFQYAQSRGKTGAERPCTNAAPMDGAAWCPVLHSLHAMLQHGSSLQTQKNRDSMICTRLHEVF